MTRLMRSLLVALATAFCALAPDVARAMAPDLPPALSEEALDEMRGGFSYGGVEVNFGAQVRTFIDGALALETTFTLLGGEFLPTGGLEAAHAGVSDALPALQAAGISLEDLGQIAALAVVDESGATLAGVRLADDAIQSIVLNTASDRAISQFLDIRIELSGYDAVAPAIAADRLAFQAAADLAFASSGLSLR